MFIGRRKELDALSSQEAQDRSNLLPIYGRRRIGKSELILHFMRGKAGLYFLGQRAAGEINLRGYCQVAAETLREPLLCRAASWEEALRETVRRWRGKGKLIICLDEFQWIAQSAPELTSVIQGLWDRDWQRTGLSRRWQFRSRPGRRWTMTPPLSNFTNRSTDSPSA